MRNRRATRREALVRLDANESVAAHAFAAFDGLQQKSFSLVFLRVSVASGKTQKSAHRRLKIGD